MGWEEGKERGEYPPWLKPRSATGLFDYFVIFDDRFMRSKCTIPIRLHRR